MRDPPLPIPNREVKPHHADGTAKVGEEVTAPLSPELKSPGLFLYPPASASDPSDDSDSAVYLYEI